VRVGPHGLSVASKGEGAYNPDMAVALLQLRTENLLEWVVLLALGSSGFCMLSLAIMMVLGNCRHYWKRSRHDRK
jgi:hypothetical protein